jgi:hypothetical protein
MCRASYGLTFVLLATSVASSGNRPDFAHPPRLVDGTGKVVGTIVGGTSGGLVDPNVWRRQGTFVVSFVAVPSSPPAFATGSLGRPLLHATADCSGARYLKHDDGLEEDAIGLAFDFEVDGVRDLRHTGRQAQQMSRLSRHLLDLRPEPHGRHLSISGIVTR